MLSTPTPLIHYEWVAVKVDRQSYRLAVNDTGRLGVDLYRVLDT